MSNYQQQREYDEALERYQTERARAAAASTRDQAAYHLACAQAEAAYAAAIRPHRDDDRYYTRVHESEFTN